MEGRFALWDTIFCDCDHSRGGCCGDSAFCHDTLARTSLTGRDFCAHTAASRDTGARTAACRDTSARTAACRAGDNDNYGRFYGRYRARRRGCAGERYRIRLDDLSALRELSCLAAADA